MYRPLILGAILLALLAGTFLPLHAQSGITPPAAAEDIRKMLFDAQASAMRGDSERIAALLDEARLVYADSLAGAIAAVSTDLDAAIRAALADLSAGSPASTIALARGTIWTALLKGAAGHVETAVTSGSLDSAAAWLPLREYRIATRFTRPAADATLALSAAQSGALDRDEAWAMIYADLFDTYQAQMTAALTAADDADRRGFSLRRAEEVGLAAGYFTILAEIYTEQRGAADAADAAHAFSALVAAADAADPAAYAAARAAVDHALEGFRAVPLSDGELARRAGQFMRYIALVPIEYARGVRDGVVTNDIEIQEAVTFHSGAAAAWADLEAAVSALDPTAADEIALRLAEVIAQIRAVAPAADLNASIAAIEVQAAATFPDAWLQGGASSDIDVVLAVLDQIATAVAAGDYRAAESARLEAYAILELGFEQRLIGFAPDMAARIESLFWQGAADQPGLAVLLASSAPSGAVQAGLTDLERALAEARLVIQAGNQAPGAVAGNAAVIVFREGLEAVLILASLLASLRAADQVRYRRPLLIGAVLACLATAATWFAATGLLAVLLPFGERLEAVVSLIAIAVLLLITNWFFHKTYWTGWMANFHARKRRLIGGAVAVTIGQAVGLVLLGFTSIYREGFETVLFLQSLVLEAGSTVVLQGVAIGLIGTGIVGVITFALQVRLPYKKMLIITGVMIGAVLLVMVGNTVHVLQAVGWLPITPINGLFLPFWAGQWFGLFATWEGILLQIAAGVFVIGSYFLAESQNKRARATPREARAANA